MEFNIIPDEDALSRCAWCDARIYDDTEVFGLGAKFRPGVELSAYQGHCIQLALVSREKAVAAMVTAEGSDAKKENKDMMFLLCSEGCGIKLKEALEKEVTIGDLFEKFEI